MSSVTLAVLATVLMFIVVLTPLVTTGNSPLFFGSLSNSPEELRRKTQTILAAYIADEEKFTRGVISKRTWHQRKAFLTSRYIDAVRRLDYLTGLGRVES